MGSLLKSFDEHPHDELFFGVLRHLKLYLIFWTDLNQFEDPREIWRKEQEEMIREYLNRGKEDLNVIT